MFMMELGNRLINAVYLVEAEQLAAGKVRVTMVSGNTFDHEGPDADTFIDQLRALAKDPHLRAFTNVIRYDQKTDKPPGSTSAGGSSVAG